jgi:hypothetical protein
LPGLAGRFVLRLVNGNSLRIAGKLKDIARFYIDRFDLYMPLKPFVSMTKEQVEEILAKSTPQEQERIKNMLQHSCSMYDYSGKHLPHPYLLQNL